MKSKCKHLWKFIGKGLGHYRKGVREDVYVEIKKYKCLLCPEDKDVLVSPQSSIKSK